MPSPMSCCLKTSWISVVKGGRILPPITKLSKPNWDTGSTAKLSTNLNVWLCNVFLSYLSLICLALVSLYTSCMAHTNLVFLCYKLRTHIARVLQRRSDAIHAALARYNQLAAKLKPPHPALSWKQVVDYGFLGEFDLLHHSRLDVHSQDW